MPMREQLLRELEGSNDVGVLLVAQMGGVPEEIQLVIQTASYDEKADGLQERTAYVIRALGVKEHRASLGVFGSLFFAVEHPILFHHNSASHEINFAGIPANPNELVLDIQAAYSATFGPWRDLGDDINRNRPLFDLLQQGSGTLGNMPSQAAERIVKVFEHHKMRATITEVKPARSEDPDEHGRTQKLKLLGIDDSYFLAYSFTVDKMGAGAKK
ncbi:MAG: hypothetical protein AAF653_14400 [Chloroflexota bacterium]